MAFAPMRRRARGDTKTRNEVDVIIKGYGVDVNKGYGVDVNNKGYGVDVKGFEVDVNKGTARDVCDDTPEYR
eukprot:9341515-Pyramimonas_sp.AAC.2